MLLTLMTLFQMRLILAHQQLSYRVLLRQLRTLATQLPALTLAQQVMLWVVRVFHHQQRLRCFWALFCHICSTMEKSALLRLQRLHSTAKMYSSASLADFLTRWHHQSEHLLQSTLSQQKTLLSRRLILTSQSRDILFALLTLTVTTLI